jgi:hypothetical protein
MHCTTLHYTLPPSSSSTEQQNEHLDCVVCIALGIAIKGEETGNKTRDKYDGHETTRT